MKTIKVLMTLLAATALIAAAPEDDFQEETIVSSIVVQAVLPGPAWWRVSDADSTVHILVIPEFAPADLTWNSMMLDARMERAKLVIMPAEVNVSLRQIPGLIRTYKGEVIDKSPLETSLPQPLRTQFIQARTASGLKPQVFYKLRPAYAGQRLERELRTSQGMVRGRVADKIKSAAKSRRVRITTPRTLFKPARVVWAPLSASEGVDRERACLSVTLQTMQPVLNAQRQAALDWAAGDVRGLLALPKLSYRPSCDNEFLARVDRTHRPELLRGQIEAIEQALHIPGESIAVVRPGLLLATDGVLMTLKARGYTIRTPANILEP